MTRVYQTHYGHMASWFCGSIETGYGLLLDVTKPSSEALLWDPYKQASVKSGFFFFQNIHLKVFNQSEPFWSDFSVLNQVLPNRKILF